MWELGISFFRRQATPTWDSGESKRALVGVRTISAPSARSTSTWGHRDTHWEDWEDSHWEDREDWEDSHWEDTRGHSDTGRTLILGGL